MVTHSKKKDLLDALRLFSQAGSVEGRAKVVQLHPQLLTPAADVFFRKREVEWRRKGFIKEAATLSRTRNFFSRCRKVGIEIASKEVQYKLDRLHFAVLAKAGFDLSDLILESSETGFVDDAIRLLRQAYDLCPDSSQKRVPVACTLSAIYRIRHELKGDDVDLNCAIKFGEEAAEAPQPEIEKYKKYINVSSALLERYGRFGQRTDLDKALELLVPAVRELPRLGDAWQRAAHNLASALRLRAMVNVNRNDIEAAVQLQKEVVGCVVPGSSTSALFFDGLANAYLARLNWTGDTSDLESAIATYRIALEDTPFHTPERARLLNNLGTALATEYEISGITEYLDEALRLFCESVRILPPPASRAFATLANLGTYMAARYSHTHADDDYAEAVHWLNIAETHFSEARNLSGIIDNLANTKFIRFRVKNEEEDLESAINLWKRSLEMPASPGHKFDRSRSLCSALSHRHMLKGGESDFRLARELFDAAIGMPSASPGAELAVANNFGHYAFQRAAASDGDDADTGMWREAVRAFDIARMAVERLLQTQITKRRQEDWIAKTQQIPVRHAYALFKSGQTERAVEALEAGRSVFLAEALERNRIDLERLGERGHHDLLTRYRNAITAVQVNFRLVERDNDISGIVENKALVEAAAEQLRQTIESIRAIPGLENFLRSLTFTEIAAAATAPIVYFLVTSIGGVAFIVTQNGVRPIRLPCTEETVQNWMIRSEPEGEPFGYLPVTVGTSPGIRGTIERLLPEIGLHLLAPVAAALDELFTPRIDEHPPVSLIPTGWLTLLPLHAATYATAKKAVTCLLDSFTVSYLPSARVLLRVPRHRTPAVRELLAVGDPEPLPQGFEPLPYARFEAAAVCAVTPGSFPPLLGKNATIAALRLNWANVNAAHLACHGVFEMADPLQSALILSGERLTLADITKDLVADRGPREVVLAACKTALVDSFRLPEEAIGFPVGFIQAGAGTAIAALWCINDWSTSLLMAMYATERTSAAPASALRRAQVWLRDSAPAELASFVEELQKNICLTDAETIKMGYEALIVASSELPPFRDPYFWAGFVCWGGQVSECGV